MLSYLPLTRESRKAQGLSQGVAVKSHESDSLMKQDTRQAQGCPDES